MTPTKADDLKDAIRRILYEECSAVVPPQIEAAVERIAGAAKEWNAALVAKALDDW